MIQKTKSLSKEKYQVQFTRLETEYKQKLANFQLWQRVSKYCDEEHSDAAYQALKAITKLQTQISERTNQQQLTQSLAPLLRALRNQLDQNGKALLMIKSIGNDTTQLVISFDDKPLYVSESYPVNSKQARTIKSLTSSLELEFTAKITFADFKARVEGWRSPRN